VGANERVKISDFGMTRDTYITDYYKVNNIDGIICTQKAEQILINIHRRM